MSDPPASAAAHHAIVSRVPRAKTPRGSVAGSDFCQSEPCDAGVPTPTSREPMTDADEQPDAEPAAADGRPGWAPPPSHKTRGDVKRAVDRLLDALAPERVVSRAPRLAVPVERHRTPRGCILQAAAAAVSVTWFPDAATDLAFGELQVTAGGGVVSRPGSARREPAGATVTSETTLTPVEGGPDGWAWRAADGTVYDTDALVAHCSALLEAQVAAAGR